MRGISSAVVPALLVLGLWTAAPAGAVVINFDAPANGTVIDNYYVQPFETFVTFANPAGGSIYARSSSFNYSPGNVASPLSTGVPAFNELQGSIEATFNVVLGNSVNIVSVRTAAVANIEPIGTPQNRPYMQVYDQSNNLLGTVLFQGPLPTNPLETTAFQRLSFKMPPCTGTPVQCDFYGVGKVRLSTQLGQGGPLMYGLFDHLEFNPPTCAEPLVINGDGSSCAQTFYGDACTTWTCPAGYTKTSADPVCNNGTWSEPAVCTADACYGEPLIPFGSSTGCVGLPNGSTCTTWSCDPGYQAAGSDPLCVDGGWSGDFACYPIPVVPVLPTAGYALLVALLGAIGLASRRRRRH